MERVPSDEADRKVKPCPICGRPALDPFAPFCSKRCADVDLHRWLGGVYAVPVDDPGWTDEPGASDQIRTDGEH